LRRTVVGQSLARNLAVGQDHVGIVTRLKTRRSPSYFNDATAYRTVDLDPVADPERGLQAEGDSRKHVGKHVADSEAEYGDDQTRTGESTSCRLAQEHGHGCNRCRHKQSGRNKFPEQLWCPAAA